MWYMVIGNDFDGNEKILSIDLFIGSYWVI